MKKLKYLLVIMLTTVAYGVSDKRMSLDDQEELTVITLALKFCKKIKREFDPNLNNTSPTTLPAAFKNFKTTILDASAAFNDVYELLAQRFLFLIQHAYK